MKKIVTFFLLALPLFLFSQVGIGTTNPRGALDINDPNGTNKHGLILPTTEDPSTITNPQPNATSVVAGTIIFDSKEKCIKYYNGMELYC